MVNNNNFKKNIIKDSLIFIILLLLFILILNLVYMNFAEKTSKPEIFDVFIKTTNNSIDYLFIGDSRITYAIKPSLINNKSFNLGIVGFTYIDNYYLLKKILSKNNLKINNLVIVIDSHSFIDGKKSNLFRKYIHRNLINLKERSKFRNENIIKSYIWYYLPFIGNGVLFINEIFEKIKNNQNSNLNKDGWYNNTGSSFSNIPIERLKKIKKTFYVKPNAKINTLGNFSLFYFIEILKLAKENNINIIFIRTPMPKAYYDELEENNFSRKEHYKILFTIINNNLNNYLEFDYYNIYFNNSNYFSDVLHLNNLGAANLSIILKNDLNITK